LYEQDVNAMKILEAFAMIMIISVIMNIIILEILDRIVSSVLMYPTVGVISKLPRFQLIYYPDVATYGFFGTNNVSSTFQNQTLHAPSLNISAYYIASDGIYGQNWTDPHTGQKPFATYSNARFLYNNETYTLNDLGNGKCLPSGTYKWGFSFLLLFVFLLTLLIWSIGMGVVWVRTDLTLRAREIRDIPGKYKAIIELAEALQKEFDKEGMDPVDLKEEQITRKIRQDLKGGRIMHDQATTQQSRYRLRSILGRWFKMNKWWWLGYIFLTIFWTMPLISSNLPWFYFFLTISNGVLLVMLFTGWRTMSKVIFISFCIIVAIIPAGIQAQADSQSSYY
jgi:hypothetical protein